MRAPPAIATGQSCPVSSPKDIMLHTHTFKVRPAQVTVRFGDGAHSFLMRDGATLAELAKRIRVLGLLHAGAPISIDIEFADARSTSGLYFSAAKADHSLKWQPRNNEASVASHASRVKTPRARSRARANSDTRNGF